MNDSDFIILLLQEHIRKNQLIHFLYNRYQYLSQTLCQQSTCVINLIHERQQLQDQLRNLEEELQHRRRQNTPHQHKRRRSH